MTISFAFLFLMILCAGCVTEHDDGVVTLAGRAVLMDSTGAIRTDFSGVTVTADGTKFTATTDITGAWQIDGLPSGEYDISATKAGFGTYHWYEQTYAHGRYDLATIALAEMPNIAPVIDTAYWNPYPLPNNQELEVGGPLITGISRIMTVEGYCDLKPNVLPDQSHLLTTLSGGGSRNAVGFTFFRNDLISAGARAGDTLYLSSSIVGDAPNEGGGEWAYALASFYDPRAHETRSCTGPKSNVLTLVMH
jgi:hypothetical protein